MSGLNKVMLIGRLGKDPEVRNTNSGNVANFSMATSESYKDKTTGEKKETTEWHNIVCWNNLADIVAKYLHKGDNVYIEGKLKTETWEKDGVKHYTTKIVASNMVMLTPKGQSQQAAPSTPAPKPDPDGDDFFSNSPGGTPKTAVPTTDATDDLPF